MAEMVGVAPQELSEQEAAEVRKLAEAIGQIFGLKPKYIDAGFGEYDKGTKSWFTTRIEPSIYEGKVGVRETAESCVRIDRHFGNERFPASKTVMLQDRVMTTVGLSMMAGSRSMHVVIPDDLLGKPKIILRDDLVGAEEFAANPQAQMAFIRKFVNAL